MKWSRAVHHVEWLAETCADMVTRPESIYVLRVTQLWAFDAILEAPRDLEWVDVAMCVDVPADEMAWKTEPTGAQHWMNASRLQQKPFGVWWRSEHAPVWNHRIVRPSLVWDAATGVYPETLEALRTGDGEKFRLAAPTADELEARLVDERRISLAALTSTTRTYQDRRWAPGKIWPIADALCAASDGYLDLLDAS